MKMERVEVVPGEDNGSHHGELDCCQYFCVETP